MVDRFLLSKLLNKASEVLDERVLVFKPATQEDLQQNHNLLLNSGTRVWLLSFARYRSPSFSHVARPEAGQRGSDGGQSARGYELRLRSLACTHDQPASWVSHRS